MCAGEASCVGVGEWIKLVVAAACSERRAGRGRGERSKIRSKLEDELLGSLETGGARTSETGRPDNILASIRFARIRSPAGQFCEKVVLARKMSHRLRVNSETAPCWRRRRWHWALATLLN